MRPTRISLKRSLLLGTFATLCLFSTAALAQQNDDDNTTVATATDNNNQPATTANNDDEDEPAPTQDNNNDDDDDEEEEATTTRGRITITNTGDDEPTDAPSSSIPRITGGSVTQGPVEGPSDLPTLTGIYNTFSYPPPSVPPTADAPFMQTSSLPDGTVFICVGAILGAFGAAVLIWRGIVACLLHRSVERAAVAQHAANDKASTFPAPPAPFYKYSDAESKASLPMAGRRTTRGPIPSTPSQTNLFFSPTAPGGTNGHNSRDSRASYMPSGFYPAGNGGTNSPQNGGGLGQQQPSISLTNLRPTSRGQVVSMTGPSPPDSPAFGPRSTPGLRNVSTSSLNRPPSQRAPSAYLEDLLDDNPAAFPPQGGLPPMPQQGGHGQQGRF